MRKLWLLLPLFWVANTAFSQEFDPSRLVRNAIKVCGQKHEQENPAFFSCISGKSLEYYDALSMQDKRLYQKLAQFAYTVDEMEHDYKRDALNEAQFRWLAGLYLSKLLDDMVVHTPEVAD